MKMKKELDNGAVALLEKDDGVVRLVKTADRPVDSKRKLVKGSLSLRRLSMNKNKHSSSFRLSSIKGKSPTLSQSRLFMNKNSGSDNTKNYDDLYNSFLQVKRENIALRSLAVPKNMTIQEQYEFPKPGTHPDFPFDALVFQGGGAKGTIYFGAVLALEELGILPYIKRFAGASAGSGSAVILALGLDASQIKEEMEALNLHTFFDSLVTSSGAERYPKFMRRFVTAYNVYKTYGMHPGDAIYDYYGKLLKKHTGNADLTFMGLYLLRKRELCIAVVNLSRGQTEYCHVNTTPDMPIRLAIRASMSLPFVYKPVELSPGECYVDGGVLDNYPLRCFDGWYLSTQDEDDHLSKVIKSNPDVMKVDTPSHEVIQAMSDCMSTAFVGVNTKTIGFRLSNDESAADDAYTAFQEKLRTNLHRQASLSSLVDEDPELDIEVPLPNTKLANAYKAIKASEEEKIDTTIKYDEAYTEFNRWLCLHVRHLKSVSNEEHPHALNMQALLKHLQESPPRTAFSPEIFGYYSWAELLDVLDDDGNGYITTSDFSSFWDKHGVHTALLGNKKVKTIETIQQFGGDLMQAIWIHNDEDKMKIPSNAKRTCSLDTKYISTLDMDQEKGDKDYLYAVGKNTAMQWLKERANYLRENKDGEFGEEDETAMSSDKGSDKDTCSLTL